MKKKSFLTMLCTMICCVAFGATAQRTILSHNGTLTQYDSNHWMEAIGNAVEGDTVYFTSGAFTGVVTITKPIVLIGAGATSPDDDYFWRSVYNDYCVENETYVENFHINIPGSITLTKCMFEGMHIGSITIQKSISGLSCKRCRCSGLRMGDKDQNTDVIVTGLVLESCFIVGLDYYDATFSNIDIHNCILGNLFNREVENVTFTNCALTNDCGGFANDHFVNCIIKGGYWEHQTFVNSVTTDGHTSTSSYTNCKVSSEDPTSMTAAVLQSKGYLGNDGKVVGPLGGSTPFTLRPSQPYISSSTLSYSSSTKKLSVNVTVKQGQ